ncbi:PREDICTED: pentatricopeptide repeat-containing protein At3g18110, chloroplastic [Tarenaya hassleriana]|uniref:pentatricopeptide repeat-containing protein At3g18110, chloroplastic n=1 Tax=Tarenaya hassleriana TaxID=28532 RepID=UPI00053C75DC|nr:PREDICTED: pentatricopeptide repeat-containing protein At3g18110, chloroplastic [Tarenaya hassleriana]
MAAFATSLSSPPSLSVHASLSSSAVTIHRDKDEQRNNNSSQKFTYSRASPAVRWPHLNLRETSDSRNSTPSQPVSSPSPATHVAETPEYGEFESDERQSGNDETAVAGRRKRVKKMSKLALKRAKDWRERVKFLTDKILGLKPNQFVADVLDGRPVQMTPTDYCFVVKWVGQENWQRALEVFEWLNLRHWYSPNARMVATILGVLGRWNQESLAVEIFTRAEPSVGDTVQVYNAMMAVYARSGKFSKAQELLDAMRERGCVPDLISFNTLINARLKAGALTPNLAIELLNTVRNSRLRPDTITYNTLLSACSRDSNLEEAVKVFEDMESHSCQPDLWTYNAMISVYGRCGLADKAEELFRELELKGFSPDAVTYNSLLYAFARERNTEKVKEVCEEMQKMGFGRDEMTYNTIIHMYGKQGQLDLALQLYKDMKSLSGRNPDAVTYTVLIDSLGKANRTLEAAALMSEMLDAGIKPTLQTFSALICGYAKAGKREEAEETFDCMLRSGIKPDNLAYSVMLDIFLRGNETKKAWRLYRDMVSDGHTPSRSLYELMLSGLMRESKTDDIQKIIRDMEEISHMNPQEISSVLVKGECFDLATRQLKAAIVNGYELENDSLLSILNSYSSSGRHSEASELLEFFKEHAGGSERLINDALIVLHCKSNNIDAALGEYFSDTYAHDWSSGGCTMYESLIQCCVANERNAEACQVFSDLRLYGREISENVCRNMVVVYCKLGFPETAHHIVNQAETKGFHFDNSPVYTDIIEAYGKLKQWQQAESVVGALRQNGQMPDLKTWNSLMQAYAESGCYERARAVFNTMMRDGPSPTVESINILLQALIADGRLEELYVVVEELQDMGYKISKSSILLMLDAFARAGNIFEVKKIYNSMKAAGYLPTIRLYRMMIELLCKGKRVRDAEVMVSEMEEAGFKLELPIWNSLLKMYTAIEDFKRTVQVYQRLKETGLEPDETTYNTLITMYCRDRRPEEGYFLMQHMRKLGLDPKLDTYKSLISAFGKQKSIEQAEELFQELISKGYKLDRSFYHTMMKIFRDSGNDSKAEKLLEMMKSVGIEPTLATMHLLMVSYSGSGKPQEAEKVLANLRETNIELTTLTYSSVIDAYLRNKDYNGGREMVLEMKREGVEPDHRIWTCFIRAASLSKHKNEVLLQLKVLQDIGFDLPIRILAGKSELLISEVDGWLEKLKPMEDNAALNFTNALVNLLWAFELRATASWVFQLAIKWNIYNRDVFRVADKDWGADFRKLSGGAALVALTLWLDHMQDASLEGYPESPKSVVLITGTAEYNDVSLEKTLKVCLWEMGSPFLPCKTRTGLLVAKAHSLRMWLKDSPFCFDLELKDSPSLPETNSMELIDGCFIRRGLVPAFNHINERLGGFVSPKKFSRLALLPDEMRERVIQADIEGHRQKIEKMKMKKKIKVEEEKARRVNGRRKYIRRRGDVATAHRG